MQPKPLSIPGKARLLVALACLLGLASPAARAQTRPQVRSLDEAPRAALFVGNSFFYYNNGLNGYVSNLLGSTVPPDPRPFRSTLATISGASLQWHDVASLLRPDAVASFGFGAGNTLVPREAGHLFDAVVMMDCSLCPLDPVRGPVFREVARRNSEIVRAGGARPVFFMTWAYGDRPEMTAALAEAYTAAGNDNGALVIPAGLAFARALAERPEVELYTWDKRHPSVAGTYLAASTAFAALFDRSPEENTFTAGLDPGTARFLRAVAWRTVRDYRGDGGGDAAARAAR